jgi:hypothetical protein
MRNNGELLSLIVKARKMYSLCFLLPNKDAISFEDFVVRFSCSGLAVKHFSA